MPNSYFSAFVKSDRPAKFPNLQIKYVRGLDPIIKLMDKDGNVQDVSIVSFILHCSTYFTYDYISLASVSRPAEANPSSYLMGTKLSKISSNAVVTQI
jgi:hypothetical protein